MNHLRELASWYFAVGCGVATAESIMIIGTFAYNKFEPSDAKILSVLIPANAVLCAVTWPSFPYYTVFPGKYTLAFGEKPVADGICGRVDDGYLNSKALYMPALFTMATCAAIYTQFYEYSPFGDGVGSKIGNYRQKFRDINYIA